MGQSRPHFVYFRLFHMTQFKFKLLPIFQKKNFVLNGHFMFILIILNDSSLIKKLKTSAGFEL